MKRSKQPPQRPLGLCLLAGVALWLAAAGPPVSGGDGLGNDTGWLAGCDRTEPEEQPLVNLGSFGSIQSTDLGALHDDFRLRPSAEVHPPPERQNWWDRLGRVTQGRVQIEAGYIFTYDRPAGASVYEHAVGDMLLRVGLGRRLELRVGWPGWVATSIQGEGSSSQTLNPNVGFMLDLWPQRSWRPQTAVLAAVPITLQGDPFALDSLQPLSQLLYLWQLGDRWWVGGTTGVALFDIGGDRFVELQQTASADFLLASRLSTFIEWSMLVDHGASHDGSEHMLGGGFSLLISESVQATWRAAMGLDARAPDFLTGIRLAIRFRPPDHPRKH